MLHACVNHCMLPIRSDLELHRLELIECVICPFKDVTV